MTPTIALQPRQAQTAVFSPRLQQAVRLLQMSALDYAQALRDAAQLNPFLDVEEPDAPQEPGPKPEAEAQPDTQFDTQFDTRFDTPSDEFADAAFDRLTAAPAASAHHLSHDESFDLMQRVALPDSLRAHLHAQVGVLRLDARDAAFAAAVVEALDEDGYLRISLEELGVALGEPAAAHELRIALRRVQALDPPGVAARDVPECLRLQLGAVADPALRALAQRILEQHVALLAQGDCAKLAKALGVATAQVRRAVDAVRQLDPRPGWRHDEAAARLVTPDVVVRKVRGSWKTSLVDGALPRVRVNAAYARLLEQHRKESGPALKDCLEHARWTVGNAEQRAATILGVASAIVERQRMFLEHGPLAMKPLGLREIADEVGVHPSTVSRTVHNKYLSTPFGVFELQHFFSRGLTHAAGGASAPMALQALIRELIAVEAPVSPLSDAALARQLARQGFRIARRTVTKYRQNLNIEPVERRRMQAALRAA
jgi:RNA polymerase sigma-54 factor